VAVPVPALSELLATDGTDLQDVLTTFRGSSFIRIESLTDLPVPASQQAFPFPDAAPPVTAAAAKVGESPAAAEPTPAKLQTEPQPVTGELPKPNTWDELEG
jgi:hypothetical protein